MKRGEKIRKVNGWKTLAIVLIVIFALLAAGGTGVFLLWRSEGHQAMRDTRNVWNAINLTRMEYYGGSISMYDEERASGLRKEAEKQVREYTSCPGDFMVLSHDAKEVPTSIIYHEDRYTVYYYLDEDGERHFETYRNFKLFDVDSGALKVFGAQEAQE